MMVWKYFLNRLITKHRGIPMLKSTSSSIRKQLSSFDGSKVVYSASNRHEVFMKRVENGPALDAQNFNSDISKAFTKWKNSRK